MSKKRLYTSEFKEEAVKMALASDESTATTARDLGIKESTLYNWVSRAMKDKTRAVKSGARNSKNYQELEKDNRELQRKLKKAEMERDILKKAAAYFANQEL